MPRIPEAASIRRRIPSGEAPIVQTPNIGGQVGQSLRGVVGDIRDVREAKVQFQANVADTAFRTAQMKVEAELADDNEFTQFGEKYDKRISDALQSAAEGIEDAETRNIFMERAKLSVEQGRVRVSDLAQRKETDYNRGVLTEALTAERENALQGDMTTSLENVRGMIASAIDAGYYDNEEGAKVFESWRQDAAVGRLKMLEPEERMNALEQPWAQNIPSDTRAVLLRDARSQNRSNRAIETVNRYIDEGITSDQIELLSRKDSNGDPKLQELIQNEFYTRQRRLKQAGLDAQIPVVEEYGFRLETGDIKYADIPEEDLQKLTNSQRAELQRIESIRVQQAQGAPPVMSDQSIVDQLMDYKRSGQWDDAREFYTSNFSRLDKEDRKTWGEFIREGSLPPETESALNDQQAITALVDEIGLNKDNRSQAIGTIRRRYDEWRRGYVARYGKEPDPSLRDKILDGYMTEVDTSAWIGGTKRVFELENVDPAFISAFKATKGREPTPDELRRALKERGLLGG